MYNIVLYRYIKKRARKNGISISYNEIEKRLKQVDLLNTSKKIKVLFLLWKAGFSKSIEATAIFPLFVICSYEWAVQLVIDNSENIINEFLITLCHELAHQDGDFAVLFWERKSKHYLHKKDRKFVNWVTEVHHDFAATEKMANSSREKLLVSMDYKIAAKPNSIDSRSHPSWEHRKEYAELGAFNEKLIRRIALDVDCKNETLITDVAKFYKDIILI